MFVQGKSFRSLSVLNTGTVVVAGAAFLIGLALKNRGAAERFVKFYDKATAPTATDTPLLVFALAANEAINLQLDKVAFTTGLSIRATTGIADGDNGAPTANDVVCNLFYF